MTNQFSALQQVWGKIRNFAADAVSNAVQAPVNRVVGAVQDLPFTIAQHNINAAKTGKTPVSFKQAQKQDREFEARYNRLFPPIMQSDTTDSMFMPWAWDSRPANPSAQLDSQVRSPYYYEPPKGDPQLEQIKQKVLANPNVRPAARDYLMKVPVSFQDVGKWGGLAHGVGTPQQHVAVSQRYRNPPAVATDPNQAPPHTVEEAKRYQQSTLEDIIRHELLHETPRLAPTKMYKPTDKKKIESYVNRWGKKYMNNPQNPDALVEEMFAEQDLPPVYYWHIFKNVVPNATPQGFVNTIKSLFAEPNGYS